MELDAFRLMLEQSNFFHENELDQLEQFLNRAHKGMGSFVVIRGAEGTGKNALVRRFEKRAKIRGAVVGHANFEKSNQFSPYTPFFKAIEDLASNSGHLNFRKILEQLKNTPHKFDDIASWYSLQAEFGLIQQHISDVLLKISHSQLCVLTFTNAQFAPHTTWLFFHYLSKRIAQHKIVFLILIQDMQVAQTQNFEDVLQRMNREQLIEKIELNRITESQMKLYLRNIFSQSEISLRFREHLYKLTGGRAGFIRNALIQLFEQNLFYKKNDIWFSAETIPQSFKLNFIFEKESLNQTLTILDNVTDLQKKLIHYAVLIGDSIDYHLLAELLEIPRRQVIREFLFFREKKIFVETDSDTFDFCSLAFRNAILSGLPEAEAKTMRLEITRIIEKQPNSMSNSRIYLIAQLYDDAGEFDSAFQWLQKAFDVAFNNLALSEAKDFFNRAEKIKEHLPENAVGADNVNWLIKAAWINRVLGNYESENRLYEQALQLCADNDLRTKRVILSQKGLYLFRLNQWEAARNHFNESLADNDDPFVAAIANYGLGNISIELAQYSDAQHYYHLALEMAQKINARTLIAKLLNNLGIIENILENRMQAIAYYSQTIPMFESLKDSLGLARTYHNIGMTYADEGDWKQANEFYGKSLKISDTMGFLPLMSITFLNRAFVLLRFKRFSEACEYNCKAYNLLERLKDRLGIAEYHKIQGMLETEFSNWAAAEKHLKLALEQFTELKNKLGIAETEFELGILGAEKASSNNGMNWLKRAREHFKNLGLSGKVKLIDDFIDQITLPGFEENVSTQ